ncbi:MAG: fructose-bisphosphatase class I [Dehalococcoidia bacterium]|nr:fructose-bisphosphatase class I [Dehalococcoidia bacterium]
MTASTDSTASTGSTGSSDLVEGVRMDAALAALVPAEVAVALLRFAEAAVQVRDALATAPLDGTLGKTGATNVQQEDTAKLDHLANDIFHGLLASAPGVARLISEEDHDPVEVGDGPYTLCFDPLDGSSNIGVASVGSVLGIYEGAPAPPSEASPMSGRQLVASAFVVYGLPTVLVVATREAAAGFAFDPADRTWRLAFPGIRIPEAQYASVNWTNRGRWPARVTAGVDAASAHLGGRYSGSMVEDVLRVLLSGGVFMYPEDAKSPAGKLRMLYEVCPIGLVMVAAGGAAMDGARSVLDVPVTAPHQRSPFVAGEAAAVERYREAYASTEA